MMKETMRRIDDKSVESSLGWQVVILSRDYCEYLEVGKTIRFALEDRPNERGDMEWIIYLPATWMWNNSRDNDLVTQDKITEILNRVDLAFWKLDMTIKEMI